MNILEKNIEDLIWEALQTDTFALINSGFPLRDGFRYFRQPNFGSYGIADLVAVKVYKTSIHIVVYELKKDKINTGTFLQAIKYAKAIDRLYLKNIKRYCSFEYVLIGKEVDTNSSFCYLTDMVGSLSYYTYSLDLGTGLKFHRKRQYALKNEPNIKFSISDIKTIIDAEKND